MKLKEAFKASAGDIGGDGRLDVLDGVRALFVLIVAWYHIWQQSWLSPAVTVFGTYISLDFLPRSGYMFVDGMLLLSGLLLYYPLTDGKRTLSVLPFYKKRLVRILPSYLLCIVIMLLFYALPCGKYASFSAGFKDVLAHLTFTHTFFPFSYQSTPLNGALWTLAVEMQFYLLFPLLARGFRKHPVITFSLMTGAAFAYRACVAGFEDTAMYINQLPAFLDVYALGFLAAKTIALLKNRMQGESRTEKLLFSAVAVLCCVLLVRLLQEQAGNPDYASIRLGQLAHRFPLAVLLAVLMVSLCFSLPTLRFLFGNPLMRFFSVISFQYYIWHQVFAVRVKEWGLIPAESPEPWRYGERAWQHPYTAVCLLGALIIAVAVTCLFEKPLARRLSAKRKSALSR